jgi:hypothetical protein
MRLNLPEQNAPTATSTPSEPRKLKKLLSAQPNSSMGELTKQTFQILRDLNRQTMPGKQRLENLKILRPQTDKIFDNLKKYFVYRELPLSEKSQKIIKLNQSILQELIFGYEIIAYESANKIGSRINDTTLRTSICRALNYLSEMLLRSSEVYKPCAENLWHDAHQLYLYAEEKNLVDDIVIDKEREVEETTIANSYKHILLFALAQPITLGQSDINRVYKALFKWSQHVTIQREVSESLIDRVFCMRIDEDTAPHYLSEDDLAENLIIRTLDTSKLVSHVNTLIEEQSKSHQKFAVGDAIPLETLITLVRSWGENPKRQFSRAERHGHINIAIGLSNIYKVVQNKPKMVTKGCILTYEKDKPLNKQHADSHWEVVNISPGGYCLRWNSEDTSKAQVGELIAIQEFHSDNSPRWQIGVIRWMQLIQKKGLEIGVRILSPEVVTATVQNANRLDEAPIPCLMLPDIKALKQKSSTILPSFAFKTDNKLIVQTLENKLNITLSETKEHTSYFTQFTYKDTELDQQIKKQMKKDATNHNDDFDELWASL